MKIVPRIDMAGWRFGRLLVERVSGYSKDGRHITWLCKCDCGAKPVVIGWLLRSGFTKSCGCLSRETTIAKFTTHGMAGTRIYAVWNSMVMRCHNKNSLSYKHYGAKGIKVCKRWRKFENFLDDMGQPDVGLQLERKNNNGNYTPANCKWATLHEQARNKSTSRKITFNGKTLCLCDWSKIVGIGQLTISCRIDILGWSVRKALTTPVNVKDRSLNRAKSEIAKFNRKK